MKRLTLILFAACSDAAAPPPPSEPVINIAGVYPIERYPLEVAELTGSSDLAATPDGLWAIPERRRTLISLAVSDGAARVTGGLPIAGVPADHDTESLAWLGADRWAFGTETLQARGHDLVLLAQRRGDRIEIEDEWKLDYAPFETTPAPNKGIEALCWAPPHLIVGSEHVIDRKGRRSAPVWRCDLETRSCDRFKVALTSASGRLSAIACHDDPGGLEVLGIERHYDVSRLIRFTLPKSRGGMRDVPSTMQMDLVPLIGLAVNLEGLVWQPDNSLLILSDNDTGGARGPTLLFRTQLLYAARTR